MKQGCSLGWRLLQQKEASRRRFEVRLKKLGSRRLRRELAEKPEAEDRETTGDFEVNGKDL